MRLSKIKLSGFKSFVDPTTIAFPGNLTGIVGPNGCGKSNILDAVRWVLGEGSAKTLRGDSMADVIFNGSSARMPVGQASVEVTFDNTDATLGGPYAGYAEVAVRRTVSRDGTSQYFLNNTRCRRKDITQILLGTGVGSHGYCIIEQGMISRLVEAKPEELRGLLEEAAGISKYKERRRETEHRIRHARENLERLGDLREEVDKQLRHLQRQARAAERYKALKAEQRRVEAQLLVLRLMRLKDEMRGEEVRRQHEQTTLDAVLAGQRSTEAAIERLRAELAERSDTFGDIQGGYYKIQAEIARLQQSIRHRKELRKRQQQDLEAVDAQLTEIQAHIESDRVDIEAFDRALSELGPAVEQAQCTHRASLEALGEAEAAAAASRERYQALTDALAEAQGHEQLQTARREHLHDERRRVEQQRRKLAGERAALSSEEFEQRLEVLVGEEATLGAACRQAQGVLDTVWQQIRTLQGQQRELVERLEQTRTALHRDSGRLTSLEALQRAALGSNPDAVSRWLEARQLGSEPRLAQRLVVEPGWELAVETVLGSYLQAVCVEGIEALAEGLSDLAEGSLTLLDAGSDESAPQPDAAPSLVDYVRGPGVARLLDGVRTAESTAQAVELRRQLAPHESVVTPQGLWLGADFARVNRSDDPRAGILGRGDEIKRMGEVIAAGRERARRLEQALADARARLEALEAERADAQTESTRRQQRYTQTKGELEGARTSLEQAQARAEALERTAVDLDAERRTLAAALTDCEAALRSAGEHRGQLESSRDALKRLDERHETDLKQARERAADDRDRVQAVAMKVESGRSARQSAAAALERVRAQQAHLAKRRAELHAQWQSAAGPLTEEERCLETRLGEHQSVERRLAAARTAMEAVEAQLGEAAQRRADQEPGVTAAREAVEEAGLAVRAIEVRTETLAEALNRTGFDAAALAEGLDDQATVEDWEASVEQLGRRIRRLGDPNLAAIHEFEQQSERKAYLDSQFTDLTEALETLERAIRKIDRETRTRFKETFDAANAGLGRLFPRLYGGGHAFLELDGDDLLNSGVTVMARPPGKRISTIHLLSGGEKALTAVALVFSIFELNPAPFCLLDEVDAPLDDANVGRFSEIVREMAQRVQFVLITHNKATMETVHRLVGVTMNEPGVSRLVAVDMDEAVQLAAM